MRKRTAQKGLAVIAALYLVLGGAYSVVNPIFESPDEELNYENIRFFVEERRLPVLEPDELTKAHHPPLYYFFGALLTFWVPNENLDDIAERVNPFWAYRLWEPGVDNKSLYLHNPALERFPYQDVTLGVHLVRWLSVLMGLGTVLLIYGTARELFPHRPTLAVGAAALVAFNPMFLYISSSVHDDPLANLVAAGMIFVTTRLMVRGPTRGRAVALGLLVGLGFITKLTCLLVVPTAGLALLWRAWIDQGRAGWRDVVRLGGIVLAVALLVGGWWFVRNQLVYREPTSMGRQMETWGVRENAPNVLAAARELGFLHDSMWGIFGYGQIPMPRWIYGLVRLLGLLAAGGGILFWVRHRSGRAPWPHPPAVFIILLSAPLVAFLAVFSRMTLSARANFGRYLFVALPVIAYLYVLGVGEMVAPPRRPWVQIGLIPLLLGLAIFALLGVLRPAYTPPPMLSAQEIDARSQPVDVRFGPSVHLVGYAVDRNRVSPGGMVAVTLCWEALAPMEEDYAYFIHFLGPQESIVGARNTHPGLGRYPTSCWEPGDRFCDVVRVPVETWTPAPAVYGVEVGWFHPETEARLSAYDANGSPMGLVVVDRIKVVPDAYPVVVVPNPVDADLGGQVTLLGYRMDRTEVAPGEEVHITLYWTAQVPPPADYTVFVHLVSEEGPPHAQDDVQPQHGAYPTSFWDVGEVVTDPHVLSVPADLPPGDYPLVVGMYLLATGERLPWYASDGTVRGDAVDIGTITFRSTPPSPIAPSPTPLPTESPSPSPTPTPQPVEGYWIQNTTADGLCSDAPRFVGFDSAYHRLYLSDSGSTVCFYDDFGLDHWQYDYPSPMFGFPGWISEQVPGVGRITGAAAIRPSIPAAYRMPSFVGPNGKCILTADEYGAETYWQCLTTTDGLPFTDIHGYAVSYQESVEWFMSADRVASRGLEMEMDIPLREVVGAADARPTCITAHYDVDDPVWVGTNGYGLIRIDPLEYRVTRYTTADGLPDDTIRDVQTCSRGETWVATPGGVGLGVGEGWTSFTVADGLPSDDVRGVSSGDYYECRPAWAATAAGPAVLRENSDYWEPLPNFPAGVEVNDVMYGWFTTAGQGLLRFHFAPTVGGTVTSFTTADGLPDDRVTALAQTAEGILVGTPGGAAVWDGATWTLITDAAVNDASSTSIATEAGLWVREEGWSQVTTERTVHVAEGGWYATPHQVCRWAAGAAHCPPTEEGNSIAAAHILHPLPSQGELLVIDGEATHWFYRPTACSSGCFVAPEYQPMMADAPFAGQIIDLAIQEETWRYATPRGLYLAPLEGAIYPDLAWGDFSLGGGWPIDVRDLAEEPTTDTVWVVTDQGVFYAQGQREWTYVIGLPAQELSIVLPLPDGDAWIGSADAGVVHVDLDDA